MDDRILLENGTLRAAVSPLGAELKSLYAWGEEYIWQADPRFWARSAPTLFPICSSLKDDRFTFDGKTYRCPKHGYAKDARFAVESVSTDRAVFLLRSDAHSREIFPFDYELRVTYALDGNRLSVDYDVKNCGDGTMYFSIGGHEGYACPEGISACELLLPEPEPLSVCCLDGDLLGHAHSPLCPATDILPLHDEDFAVDALIFDNLRARRLTLHNRVSGRRVELAFDGFDYLLVWSVPGAPFVCLEPWCGITDYSDTTGDLTKKPGIEALPETQTFHRTHTLTLPKP